MLVAPQPGRTVTRARDSGRRFEAVTRKSSRKLVMDGSSRRHVNDRSEPIGVYINYVPSDIHNKRRVARPHLAALPGPDVERRILDVKKRHSLISIYKKKIWEIRIYYRSYQYKSYTGRANTVIEYVKIAN